jgi:hypothetical protein
MLTQPKEKNKKKKKKKKKKKNSASSLHFFFFPFLIGYSFLLSNNSYDSPLLKSVSQCSYGNFVVRQVDQAYIFIFFNIIWTETGLHVWNAKIKLTKLSKGEG